MINGLCDECSNKQTSGNKEIDDLAKGIVCLLLRNKNKPINNTNPECKLELRIPSKADL